MKVLGQFCRKIKHPGFKIIPALIILAALAGCEEEERQVWSVSAEASDEFLLITAVIADFHGDFVHMSIRKKGWDNEYSIERSPADGQPERDWSRVHHWFGELNPDTYLEGRIDDGSGEGPSRSTAYLFKLPIKMTKSVKREDYKDENGSDYVYITKGYAYADGNLRYPMFPPGEYEIAIYPWHTGSAGRGHPATDGKKKVQYIHYEPITSTTFVIE